MSDIYKSSSLTSPIQWLKEQQMTLSLQVPIKKSGHFQKQYWCSFARCPKFYLTLQQNFRRKTKKDNISPSIHHQERQYLSVNSANSLRLSSFKFQLNIRLISLLSKLCRFKVAKSRICNQDTVFYIIIEHILFV